MASNSRSFVILLLTSGFIITGILFDYMPMIVDNQIKSNIELATNEEVVSIWSKPPVDLHSYYWLYDILNVESRFEKKLIELSKNKFRLTYNTTRHVKYNESFEGQGLSLDEPLKLLNPIYATMLESTRFNVGSNEDLQTRMQMFSSAARLMERFNESLFMNLTARDALLGRKVLFLGQARKLINAFGINVKLPTFANDIFGFVSLFNGTNQGPYEIYTGYQASMSSLGDLISYQGKRRLSDYQGRCNRLQASIGELRPMPLVENQMLELFQPQLCRIVKLRPVGSRKMREGLAIGYTFASEDFSSFLQNPDNSCFCRNDSLPLTNDNYCSLNGAIELGPCSSFAPIVLTVNNIQPDSRIINSIGNFEPDLVRAEVESLAHVGPQSSKSDQAGAASGAQFLILKRIGVPIWADLTITLYMKVVRDSMFKQTVSVPEITYVPLLMVRETGSIPPKLAKIIINLENFIALSYHIKVVMYLSAIVLLCYLTSHHYSRSMRDRIQPMQSASGSQLNAAIGDAGATGNEANESRSSNLANNNLSAANLMMISGEQSGVKSGSTSTDDHRFARPPGATSGATSNTGNEPGATLSERTTSADSSKSLPPSRMSRSSSLNLDELELNASQEDVAASRSENLDGGQRLASRPRAKMFSKVDEERSSRIKSAKEEDAKVEPIINPSAGSGGGKNWFLKVCTNLVKMLAELRASISDASQLNVTENNNDFQDKQLEMLAGKIDNWYLANSASNSAEPEPEGATCGCKESKQRSAKKAQGPEGSLKGDKLKREKPVTGPVEPPELNSSGGSYAGQPLKSVQIKDDAIDSSSSSKNANADDGFEDGSNFATKPGDFNDENRQTSKPSESKHDQKIDKPYRKSTNETHKIVQTQNEASNNKLIAQASESRAQEGFATHEGKRLLSSSDSIDSSQLVLNSPPGNGEQEQQQEGEEGSAKTTILVNGLHARENQENSKQDSPVLAKFGAGGDDSNRVADPSASGADGSGAFEPSNKAEVGRRNPSTAGQRGGRPGARGAGVRVRA